MKVTLKDGTVKNYKLTLKQMLELGFQMRVPARWHYINYSDIILALEMIYHSLKDNIESATL